MKKGQWHSICSSCKNVESKGGQSDRQAWLAAYPDLKSEELPVNVDPQSIERLDLRLGNKCNLKCRMCSPYSSSSWVEDWNQLGDLVPEISTQSLARLDFQKNDTAAFWEQLFGLVGNLKEVYFTGGEPLMVQAHKRFLLRCIEQRVAQNITLRYTTNGTLFDSDLTTLWSHFKQVKLRISVDGIGPLNEYIRYPSRWDKILQNLARYQDLESRPLIKIQCAVQAYNVLGIPALLEFFAAQGIEVLLDYVRNPEFLSLPAVPGRIASLARQKISQMPDHPQKNFILESLDCSKAQLWPQFLEYTEKLDQLRSQNIKQIVPELLQSV